ncbi:hypothetical protein ABBQ32_001818 [Trebouxia sp. C0010 RCD-2024]
MRLMPASGSFTTGARELAKRCSIENKVDPSFQKIQERFLRDHGELPVDLLRFIQGEARWDLRLTAWLLWLATHGSKFWKQYIQSLPKEHEMTCLLNYSPEEQPQLQWLASEAAAQHTWAQDSHTSIFSSQTGLLRSLQLANTLQDTLWAMSLVRSRTFSEAVQSTDLALMVPTADLANHSFQQNSVYALRATQGTFELKSCQPIKEGQAVCISYGADKTNAELMRDYGFFVPGNPNDRLDLAVSSWQQHAPVVAKPAQLLFKALNGSPAPLTEEQRPRLLAGPFLKAVGLAGKVQANKLLIAGLSRKETSAACAEDADLSRKLAAVLSLPVCKSASVVDGSRTTSSFWPPKSFTDSGEPALRTTLTSRERAQQRQAVDMLQKHCKSLQAWGTGPESDDSFADSSAGTPRQRQALRARTDHNCLIQAAHSVLETYKQSMNQNVVLSRS